MPLFYLAGIYNLLIPNRHYFSKSISLSALHQINKINNSLQNPFLPAHRKIFARWVNLFLLISCSVNTYIQCFFRTEIKWFFFPLISLHFMSHNHSCSKETNLYFQRKLFVQFLISCKDYVGIVSSCISPFLMYSLRMICNFLYTVLWHLCLKTDFEYSIKCAVQTVKSLLAEDFHSYLYIRIYKSEVYLYLVPNMTKYIHDNVHSKCLPGSILRWTSWV